MVQWVKYPLLRLTLSFGTGILFYFLTGKEPGAAVWFFAFFMLLFLGLLLASRLQRSAFLTNLSGLAGMVAVALAGFLLSHQRTERHQPLHLLNQPQPEYYVGVVHDYLVEKPALLTTTLQLKEMRVKGKWQPVQGQVRLTVRREQEVKLKYGDVLLVKGAPQVLKPPANPGQFDFQKYLAAKNIWHQHYLYPQQFSIIGNEPPGRLFAWSMSLRRNLDSVFRTFFQNRRESGIASALVLGVRDELDNEVRQAFANTGTMHVLAVSGLHVGLLFWVLNLLFRRFTATLPQRLLALLCIAGVIWLYAFVTGMGASVMRAAIMFSCVSVATTFRRENNVYNSLFFAALLLLLISPHFLLDVGFQLSFLAVLGIVYLQPKLRKLLKVKRKIPKYIWELATVSVAAQLATFPLGLYYFHQFPVYFLLSNLLIVPFATVLLYGGFLVLLLGFAGRLLEALEPVTALLFRYYELLVLGMNELALWLQRMPVSLLNGFTLTPLQVWLLYTFLLLLLVFLARRRLVYFSAACACMAVMAAVEVQADEAVRKPQLVFYHVPKQTVVGLLEAPKALVLSDTVLPQQAVTFNLQQHLWQRNVYQPVFASFSEKQPENALVQELPDGNRLLVWRGLRVLFLEKPLQHPLPAQATVDYLVLRRNVKVKPELLLQSFRFRQVILDSSSRTWYVQRMSEQLSQAGMAFHAVPVAGAFVVEVE